METRSSCTDLSVSGDNIWGFSSRSKAVAGPGTWKSALRRQAALHLHYTHFKLFTITVNTHFCSWYVLQTTMWIFEHIISRLWMHHNKCLRKGCLRFYKISSVLRDIYTVMYMVCGPISRVELKSYISPYNLKL